MALSLRTLPPAEWPRLLESGLWQGNLPNPDYAEIIVVELDGRIVGVWGAMNIVMLIDLKFADEVAGHAGVARLLLSGMLSLLLSHNVQVAFATTQTPEMQEMALRLGFEKMPGDLLALPLVRKEA